MKIAIFTAIFGGFDILRKPKEINPNVDYYCFSDIPLKCKPWKNVIVQPEFSNLRKNARKIKALSHVYLKDYEMTIWIDGQSKIMRDPISFLDKWLGGKDIAVLKHYSRDCIYIEAEACIRGNKDNPKVINNQMDKYQKENYPHNNGLAATSFLIRKHTNRIKEFNNLWWSEINNYSFRDQLSFNYALYKLKIECNYIPIPNPHLANKEFIKMMYHGSRFGQMIIVISSYLKNFKNLFK